MDARPVLVKVAWLLSEHRLEAILIGNAAAALQGAPVTTIDMDFLFRKTPGNLARLKRIAADLGAVVLKPFYPVSGLYRVMRDDDGLQLDFMTHIHGVRSFNSLRARCTTVRFGEHELLVASLADVILSKRAANRPRDRADIAILEKTLEEKEG
jgi:hypothetical protein